jgi:hypothetical protein
MKKLCALIIVSAASWLAGTGSITAQQGATAPNAADTAPAPYIMSMGDMMDTFIQPRHAKLGLAGHAGNWPLAAYALSLLREDITAIAQAKPKFSGMPVGELASAALGPPMDAVEAAIKSKDQAKFATAYDQLTQGCNACHSALNHPFVVIKPPDASTFANQDFGARR